MNTTEAIYREDLFYFIFSSRTHFQISIIFTEINFSFFYGYQFQFLRVPLQSLEIFQRDITQLHQTKATPLQFLRVGIMMGCIISVPK
jgi:hypothetical protein